MKKAIFLVRGIVQGVGFRPFVHNLAVGSSLSGYVKNLGTRVEVVVEGRDEDIEAFAGRLKAGTKLSRIDSVDITYEPYTGAYGGFRIEKSAVSGFGGFIPPDTGICNKCIEDMKGGTRFKDYWATSCVDCGPRYAIMDTLPYDRDNTTMADFPFCEDCLREYKDPADRRYHAQGFSCPKCGPRLSLYDQDRRALTPPLDEAIRLLNEGGILAIKGVGGFHLCCRMGVAPLLRRRRNRPEQPFALMAPLDVIEKYAYVNDGERELLDSMQRPIVLLRSKPGVPEPVAPGLPTVGFMTPYTRFPHLIFKGIDEPLIMTSANLPSEPMVKDNEEALTRLKGIADYYLVHDRRILNRCDDSVLRYNNGRFFTRMARGYAPAMFVLKERSPRAILAMGPELNSSVSVYKDNLCYTSHHLGHINNPLALEFLKETVDRLLKMTQVRPEVVACDMHPSFLSSRLGRVFAQKYNAEVVTVQHHRAHVGSLVAEGVELGDVVGVAMDGVGYGEDGTVWGGEVFYGEAHPAGLLPVPMPGGDLATKFPMRMVAGILYGSVDNSKLLKIMGANMGETEAGVILKQIERKVNVAYSSSAGRVLDAVAALLGVCYRRTYEGEPAMKLESFAFRGDARRVSLPCDVISMDGRNVVDSRSLLGAIVDALDEGKDKHDIAAAAQVSLARAFAEQACDVAKKTGAPVVGFSGGVAVNAAICRTIEDHVSAEGLDFVTNHKLPCGDGGVSFGQAVLAGMQK